MRAGGGWLAIVLLGAFASIDCNRAGIGLLPASPPPFMATNTHWADSVMASLSPRERIGQLFMVAAYSNRDKAHETELDSLVSAYGIGGLIFFQGGPKRQVALSNRLQQSAKVPLWIGMDAEWGLGMRLDSTISFPRQMSLGAIQDPDLVYRFGTEMARQLRRLGVSVSFSPVVDINVNPSNPVIGNRSFGEEMDRVAELGVAYMRGLQENGVLANAKHFPGHGDTDADSHYSLPVINHDYQRLDSVEMRPFRQLIHAGVGSIMVAHLHIPSLDTVKDRATTLNPKVVTGILRDSLNFDGLIFTDALNMKGVSAFYKPGELDLLALQAGNDVLLFPEDVPRAIATIEAAIANGSISQAEIDARCHRILLAKDWLGVDQMRYINPENLDENLKTLDSRLLHEDLIEASLTVLKNEQVIPLPTPAKNALAVLNIGESGESFNTMLSNYFDFEVFQLKGNGDTAGYGKMLGTLERFDRVVVNILGTNNKAKKNYGVSASTDLFISELARKTSVLTTLYANPYALATMSSPIVCDGFVIAYQDDETTQRVMAEAIAGACKATGKLPVSATPLFPAGSGEPVYETARIRYSCPERTGIPASALDQIAVIAEEGIKAQAYPGCQIMVIKNGHVVYEKAFGHFTYEEKQAVDRNTVYDIASITKIAASTAALMRLQDEQVVNVDHKLCDYLELCDTSAYYDLNLREILSHYARLQAWVPFYLNTLEKGDWKPGIYDTVYSEKYNVQVADNMYISPDYKLEIEATLLQTALRDAREYKYSDLGYYFVKDIVESRTDVKLDHYVDSVFYRPLGLDFMGYNPLKRIQREQIAPTEYDMKFRKQLVQGYVHDQGAAMLGGVGGHAGLFSNARDLGVLMQMFVNGGKYGGARFISEETLGYFTTCHYCDGNNRRGIGFDKPTIQLGTGPTCDQASYESFGHTGFTGTIAWADPASGLVYVFLSNRVYPDAENKKLLDLNLRTRIQEAIYSAYGIAARNPADQGVLGKSK